jgi:hypothetical protein
MIPKVGTPFTVTPIITVHSHFFPQTYPLVQSNGSIKMQRS